MRRIYLAPLLLLAGCDNEAETAVRLAMLDPDAAQFRGVRRCGGDRAVWEGEANGRNLQGAYTGFKHFYYANGAAIFVENPRYGGLTKRCFSDVASIDNIMAMDADELLSEADKSAR